MARRKTRLQRVSARTTPLGAILTACRLRLALSQLDVAVAVHTTETQVSNWERGRFMPRSILTFGRLADVLLLSLDDLWAAARQTRPGGAARGYTRAQLAPDDDDG